MVCFCCCSINNRAWKSQARLRVCGHKRARDSDNICHTDLQLAPLLMFSNCLYQIIFCCSSACLGCVLVLPHLSALCSILRSQPSLTSTQLCMLSLSLGRVLLLSLAYATVTCGEHVLCLGEVPLYEQKAEPDLIFSLPGS